MSVASAGSLQPQPSWNLLEDVRQAFMYPFMVNAFRAGAIVAVLAGLIGWFMVLRRQTFAGHTLAIVGYPGAAGAVLVGISATYGLFAFASIAALVIGLVPNTGGRGYSEESAVTGTVQAFALACGFLFVTLYGGFLSGANALLFGSFLGITSDQVIALLLVALAAAAVLAVIARPLLFASIDPDVARARGVPVRGLSIGFLVLLGVAAAEVSQITGTLLVFALLVVPAATAQTWTTRPVLSVLLTVLIGVSVTWISLLVAYYSPYPIGFFLTTFAFAAYLISVGWRRLHTEERRAPLSVRA
ncbi:MAG TPA: metal ABC transporter permease [Actinomycetes bacterium]|nr:metal ABC transporter permease [Actinomycetes bacterium]